MKLVIMIGLLIATQIYAFGFTKIEASRPECRDYGPQRECIVNISWETRRGNGVVTVEAVNSPDPRERRQKVFACGDSGFQRAYGLSQRGVNYVFKLYEGIRCPINPYPAPHELGFEADRVEVRLGQGGHGGDDDDHSGYPSHLNSLLEASRLRPISKDLFSTTIRWKKSMERGTGVVTVEVVGTSGPKEKLFACGDYGTADANWIAQGYSYIFRLYEGRRCPSSGAYLNPNELGQETQRVHVRIR